MNRLDCDCGTCCNDCGHTDDCLSVILTNDYDTDTTRDQINHDAYTL